MAIRIVPCLDIKDGRVVKGVQFARLQDAGDPLEVAIAYDKAGADELVMLDIGSSQENRESIYDMINRMAREITIPLTIGGGIKELGDVEKLLKAGADKVTINSAAVKNPQLIYEIAQKFGSEYITVAIDAKEELGGGWSVFVDGGKVNTHRDAVQWAMEVQRLGAGEILLTSMDRDGTKDGYDIALLKAVSEKIDIPLIASGGAGKVEHFEEAIVQGGSDAVLAASLFHYRELEIMDLKDYLWKRGINIIGREG